MGRIKVAGERIVRSVDFGNGQAKKTAQVLERQLETEQGLRTHLVLIRNDRYAGRETFISFPIEVWRELLPQVVDFLTAKRRFQS